MTGSNRSSSVAVALAALLALAAPATAQDVEDTGIAIAAVAGLNIDAEELFVGLEFWVPMVWDAGAGQIYLVPGATYYPFAGEDIAGVNVDASLWTLGGDIVWAFDGESFAPFVRGGPALSFASSDVAGVGRVSDTSFRLNVAAGGFFGMPGNNRPFAQLGVLLGDGSSLYGEAGYRFAF